MLVRAEIILTRETQPLRQGALRVRNGQIVALGQQQDLAPLTNEPIIDLGPCILSPGLINAHCHLDYTSFRGAIMRANSFTDWIKNINALKRDLTTADYLESIHDGYQLLLDSGTTTVANIEAMPEVMNLLGPPPLRVWWFLELIDLRSRLQEEEALRGALKFFDEKPDWLGGFGLSPHAPYTASIELYRHARRCAEKLNLPLTTHIAESLEEQEMFLYGKGQLYEFLKSIGRDCSDCEQGSALSHLLEFGALGPSTIAVHLNYLQDYDWEPLFETGLHVVHCPKCHAYFGHQPFPMERLRAGGLNISIGTDSLASNNSLDLRSEIREAQRNYPDISPRRWWEMVTLNPARALGQSGKIGEISIGAFADLVAFPLVPAPDPYTAIIKSRAKPRFLMINGEILRHEK